PVLQLHIVAALLGYSAITIAGIYSLLYILLQRDIESNRFSVLFERLPNLESLEKLSTVAVIFGFVFLTAAIATGLIWLPQSKSMSFIEPKLLGTLVVWAMYGAGLFLRRQFGWQGRRMAVMLVALFGVAMFSITALNLFSSRFHVS
ncbi:MAG: cytochrome c biogenesis protein CcsA, partial [Rhizobacter sp.]|nr:cytochrome c biogenesis protein CcsA [Chlorobiales bacterium]